MAHALKIAGRAKAQRRPKQAGAKTGSPVADEERTALTERLRQKAFEADAGKMVDATGMTDDQFIALLRR